MVICLCVVKIYDSKGCKSVAVFFDVVFAVTQFGFFMPLLVLSNKDATSSRWLSLTGKENSQRRGCAHGLRHI